MLCVERVSINNAFINCLYYARIGQWLDCKNAGKLKKITMSANQM